MKGPGLRLQILLALAGIILVAYVPLFFAIAQVTRATSQSYGEDAARSLGRAVAAHVADIQRRDTAALPRTLESHAGAGGAVAIAVYGPDGALVASGGAPEEIAALRPPSRPYGEAATRVAARSGRALDVVLPSGESAVLVRVRTEDDAARSGQLVRLIALYMTVFALALLFIAYLVLTRAIVRPIEQLARPSRPCPPRARAARSVARSRASARGRR